MSRTMPTECEHGTVIDWGDFGACDDCDDHGGLSCPNVRECPACESRIYADGDTFLAALDRYGKHARPDSALCKVAHIRAQALLAATSWLPWRFGQTMADAEADLLDRADRFARWIESREQSA